MTARTTPRARPPRRTRAAIVAAALALLTIAAVLTASACGSGDGASSAPAASSATAAGYTDIGPGQLAAMLEDKDFVLVNTHVPYEGEIEQTDLFIPYDEAAQRVGELPADKAAKIVVYCRTDHMSRIAADAWAKAGYTNLYNLDGGFVAWEAAGYPLLQEDRPQ